MKNLTTFIIHGKTKRIINHIIDVNNHTIENTAVHPLNLHLMPGNDKSRAIQINSSVTIQNSNTGLPYVKYSDFPIEFRVQLS